MSGGTTWILLRKLVLQEQFAVLKSFTNVRLTSFLLYRLDFWPLVPQVEQVGKKGFFDFERMVRQVPGKRLCFLPPCWTGKPWQISSPGVSSFSGHRRRLLSDSVASRQHIAILYLHIINSVDETPTLSISTFQSNHPSTMLTNSGVEALHSPLAQSGQVFPNGSVRTLTFDQSSIFL